jgi:hypothetical protein
MSTRSRIGMTLPGDKVLSVYCHNDGYLEGVGSTLMEHYKDTLKITELLALGDLSSLGQTTGSGDTTAYMRDRLEKATEGITSATVEDFLKIDSDWEFAYLWDGGAWSVWTAFGDDMGRCQLLTPAFIAHALAG